MEREVGVLRQNFYLDSRASSFGRIKESSSLLVMAVKLLCMNDAKCKNSWLPQILRKKEGLRACKDIYITDSRTKWTPWKKGQEVC